MGTLETRKKHFYELKHQKKSHIFENISFKFHFFLKSPRAENPKKRPLRIAKLFFQTEKNLMFLMKTWVSFGYLLMKFLKFRKKKSHNAEKTEKETTSFEDTVNTKVPFRLPGQPLELRRKRWMKFMKTL